MKKIYSVFLLTLLVAVSQMASGMSVLLVNDNGYKPDRVQVIEKAIKDAGYTYTLYDAPTEGKAPSADFMKSFDVVIWYTGNDGAGLYFWNGNDTDNKAIESYIDNGGMFWVQGLDFLYDRYKKTDTTFQSGDFVWDYLGIKEYYGQSHKDDGVYSDGVPELDTVGGNGIFTLSPLKWTTSTMWYVDALLPTSNAKPVYRMGPKDYDLSAYYSGIYNVKGKGKVLSFTFETARIDTPEHTAELFKQGLDYFKQFATSAVMVKSITINTPGGVKSIDTNKGSLQCSADILPQDATNKTLSWKIVSATATASIDQTGLLKASGGPTGNGTVWVKASAIDGSGVADSVQITITNQGEPGAYYVLLVNDDNNTSHGGTIRYQVVDTAITHAGYPVDVYNTVTTDTFPDYNILKNYKFVVWYTGNDGVNLKLWDVSDSSNIQFNAPLKQYIDNGGVVWLQGLDFLYDIYGGKYTGILDNGDSCIAKFQSGDFLYDYTGLKAYVAQSHKNDAGTGVEQLDVVANNGICTLTPVKWKYSTMYYVDALEISPDAQGIYTMGPSGYVFDKYYAMMANKVGQRNVITSTFETARIDTQDNTDELFKEVLDYYKNNVNSVNAHAKESIHNRVYPNPVHNKAHIIYTLKNSVDVSIRIVDITGKVIFNSSMGNQYAGQHSFNFSVGSLGLNNGVYFYTIITNSQFHTGKIVVNK